MSDFVICREMGWTVADLEALEIDRYAVLLEWLSEQFEARIRE